METDRPVVVFSIDRAVAGLPLRVALHTHIRRLNRVQTGRVRDTDAGRFLNVSATRPMTLLAADIPFRHRLGLDVVVDGMTPIAKRAGGTLHVIDRIKRCPPIRIGRNEIRPPNFMRHIPLRTERIIIVASLGKIALLPFAAIDESDVVFRELHQWIGLLQIGNDRIGMRPGIPDNIRHARLTPA